MITSRILPVPLSVASALAVVAGSTPASAVAHRDPDSHLLPKAPVAVAADLETTTTDCHLSRPGAPGADDLCTQALRGTRAGAYRARVYQRPDVSAPWRYVRTITVTGD